MSQALAKTKILGRAKMEQELQKDEVTENIAFIANIHYGTTS